MIDPDGGWGGFRGVRGNTLTGLGAHQRLLGSRHRGNHERRLLRGLQQAGLRPVRRQVRDELLIRPVS